MENSDTCGANPNKRDSTNWFARKLLNLHEKSCSTEGISNQSDFNEFRSEILIFYSLNLGNQWKMSILILVSVRILCLFIHERQCKYDVTMRRFCATIVVAEQQLVLHCNQHATRMRHIAICGLTLSTIFFPHYLIKGRI